jgi:hypothetical protein
MQTDAAYWQQRHGGLHENYYPCVQHKRAKVAYYHYIEENEIGDKGMILLANSIRKMGNLEILYLCQFIIR